MNPIASLKVASQHTFTLYNLNDELLIRGKIERAEGYYSDARQPQPAWYVFTFAGYTLYRPECLPDIGFRKKIAKELYRYKVISPDGSLNEAGIKEFWNFSTPKKYPINTILSPRQPS